MTESVICKNFTCVMSRTAKPPEITPLENT
jgi:hypothetical protein